MKKTASKLALAFVIALDSCSSGSAPMSPTVSSGTTSGTVQPASHAKRPPSTVPSSITAARGYRVSVFATPPNGSTNPDSLIQVGKDVFVGFGDTVGPDGTPGPGGKSTNEIVEYDLNGSIDHIYEVPGHNDGLLTYDGHTVWAMSNEDANAILTIINVDTGSEHVYKPQAGLVNASGGLPHGGGLDDLQLIDGKVYVSASNPTTSTTLPCPANISTPGCPNGISTGPIAYVLTLNGDGTTFNLTPVVSSDTPSTNIATGASGILNATDADSEVATPDGQTLIVDSQQDSDLVFISNLSGAATATYLPVTLNGMPQQVDDSRFVPQGDTFAILADTPANTFYRIDADFDRGEVYSSGQTAFLRLNIHSGVFTPIVTGFQAPHGLLFYQHRRDR